MGKQNLFLVSFSIVAIVTIVVVAAIAIQSNDRVIDDTDTTVDECVDDIGFDYSQYDVLKQTVQAFNQYGGMVKDVSGNEITFATTYHAYLKDDLLLISSSSGKELWIYYIHDIREIRVSS